MIWSRKRSTPKRLTPDQIRHRLAEVGGADSHGVILSLAAQDKPGKARFVRVASRSNFHLSLNSVQAFGLFDRIWLHNVAHNRPAAQSSTYRRSVAGRATTEHLSGDTMAMTRRGPRQWWQVDLDHEFNLTHVVVNTSVAVDTHLTYSFDVQLSRDGTEWDTIYRNGDINSDILRSRRRAQELLAWVQELGMTEVVGQQASQDPSVTFVHGRSIDVLTQMAQELVTIIGSLHNDAGLPQMPDEMADRMEALRHQLVTEWPGLWPRSLDFPSDTFDELALKPVKGLPKHGCLMWPPHVTPEIYTADGRRIEPIRFGKALEDQHVPEAAYHALRELYHCQDSLRFNDRWWWWYIDLSDVTDADALVLRNEAQDPSYGHPWQLWGSEDLVSWSAVYDHGGVLNIFHRLLSIVWRFTWRTIDELGLLMTSMTLQRRNHAGWLISRGYLIDQEPTAGELADFHVFLEEVNAGATLQLPVLMTKHSFMPALKHLNKPEFSRSMATVADELEREFSMQAVVWFGSLLGLIRAGDYIDHDDDVDMIYFSKATTMDEVVAEQERILAHFDELDGFSTYREDWPGKNIHLAVHPDGDAARYPIDMFPAWFEDGKLQIWHDRLYHFRDFDPDLIFPLAEIKHGGHTLLGPHDPQAILKDLYGNNWRTPLRSYYHKIQIDDRSS